MQNGRKKWLVLGAVTLVAIVAGTYLPQSLFPVLQTPPVANHQGGEGKSDGGKPAYKRPSLPAGPSPKILLIRLLIGTVVVLGLCVGTLYLGKRWLGAPVAKADAVQTMNLVESLALGNRCAVHLLKVGNQQVLVGIDGAGMKSMVALPEIFDTTLHEMTEAAESNQPQGSHPIG